jgi:hypothetical protein
VKAYLINYILNKLQENMGNISSFFAVCHGLNDKRLHDFEKRMIISKLFGRGAAAPRPSPGCYGPGKNDNYIVPM